MPLNCITELIVLQSKNVVNAQILATRDLSNLIVNNPVDFVPCARCFTFDQDVIIVLMAWILAKPIVNKEK